MSRNDDFDHAGSLGCLAALIAEKRIARMQLALGNIDAAAAEARMLSADTELSRLWDQLRESRVRSMTDQSSAA